MFEVVALCLGSSGSVLCSVVGKVLSVRLLDT